MEDNQQPVIGRRFITFNRSTEDGIYPDMGRLVTVSTMPGLYFVVTVYEVYDWDKGVDDEGYCYNYYQLYELTTGLAIQNRTFKYSTAENAVYQGIIHLNGKGYEAVKAQIASKPKVPVSYNLTLDLF